MPYILHCTECDDFQSLLHETRHCECQSACGRLDGDNIVLEGHAEVICLDARSLVAARGKTGRGNSNINAYMVPLDSRHVRFEGNDDDDDEDEY